MKVKNPIVGKFFSVGTAAEFFKDMFGGIIVALVSIPISMGYAQIAGLPMQYGLYGSVIPIFLFGLVTSSRDFVFGVDAAPAALTGAMLTSMGVALESDRAIELVPLIAFFVACWLLLFYFLKAGRAVQYISEPVMGGFVSGICCTVMLMQVPKLFGGSAGSGEGIELVQHIIQQLSCFNPVSLLLGISTIIIILTFKKVAPKVPMSVIMMVAGALITVFADIGSLGVRLLPNVESGFPGINMISYLPSVKEFIDLAFSSLSIAVVIMAESLLASKANALKDDYRLDNNREILAYAIGNFASSITGCCPVNGSVSRTGIVRQFGVKSQVMSVFAAVTMLIVLCFGTFIIAYLPVPVLTAIVITALINACEFDVAARLWKTSRTEFYIFGAAFLGVLLLGTIYGVVIGVLLSFVAVIIRAVVPPRNFMGVIPGKNEFYTLGRNIDAKPIKDTVIYRFGGNLFFGNIDTFQNDIENAVTPNTKYIIVNAGAIGNIDITASDRLILMYKKFKNKNIRLYITEHTGEVNDQIIKYGGSELIKNGAVRMTMALALRDAGIRLPYPVEDMVEKSSVEEKSKRFSVKRKKLKNGEDIFYGNDSLKSSKGIQAELEWAFGKDSEKIKDKIAEEVFNKIKNDDSISTDKIENAEMMNRWGRFNMFDEDELLDRLEMRMTSGADGDEEKIKHIEDLIETRRAVIEQKMYDMDPNVIERLKQHRMRSAEEFEKVFPQAYMRLKKRRIIHIERLKSEHPELAEKYEEVYRDVLISENVQKQ